MVSERPGNPQVDRAKSLESHVAVPANIEKLLERACYDCHSNETRWPWYTALPPVAHMMEQDVDRARAAINFSNWQAGAGRTTGRSLGVLAAACAEVQAGLMPLPRYTYMHPNARLQPDEVQSFCAWTRAAASEIRAGQQH